MKSYFHQLSFLFLGLCLTLPCVAQSTEGRFLRIFVTDSATGEPLAGTFFGVSYKDSVGTRLLLDSVGASTDIFETSPYAPGTTLHITLSRKGYEPKEISHTIGKTHGSNQKYIALAPTLPAAEPDIVIDGYVFVRKGNNRNPLAGEIVRISGLPNPKITRTNQGGHYRISLKAREAASLQNGIQISFAEGSKKAHQLDSLVVCESGYLHFDVELRRKVKIVDLDFRLFDPIAKERVPDAKVSIFDGGLLIGQGTSDKFGRVTISGIEINYSSSTVTFKVERWGMIPFKLTAPVMALNNPVFLEKEIQKEFERIKRAKLFQLGFGAATDQFLSSNAFQAEALLGVGKFPRIMLGLSYSMAKAQPAYFLSTQHAYTDPTSVRFRQSPLSLIGKFYLKPAAFYRLNAFASAGLSLHMKGANGQNKPYLGQRFSMGARYGFGQYLGIELSLFYTRSKWAIQLPTGPQYDEARGSLGIFLKLDFQIPFDK